jgi:hypothetical protein
MIERFGSEKEKIDRNSAAIVETITENFGEPLELLEATPSEKSYTFKTDGIDRLDLSFPRGEIRILNIEATNQDDGYGTRMIDALIAAAEEQGLRLWAEDVRPEYDEWWRSKGFAPPMEEAYSADYLYDAENL